MLTYVRTLCLLLFLISEIILEVEKASAVISLSREEIQDDSVVTRCRP